MTSLIELVEGKHQSLNFPRGVFMTKSRSGADDEKSIEDVRKMETEFFQSHPYFNHCLKNLKHAGYENLMNTIEQLSLKSIKSSLPKVRSVLFLMQFDVHVHTMLNMLPVKCVQVKSTQNTQSKARQS